MAQRDQLGRFTGDFFAQVLAAVDAAKPVSPRDDPRLKELRAAGYTPEGIDQILAYGADHAIADPIAAAERYETEFPLPTAVTGAGGRWDGLNPPRPAPVPDMAELLASGGSDDRWLDKAIGATLQQVRGGDDTAPLHLLSAGFS